MKRFSLAHLSDRGLLRRLTALVARDRRTTADLVAHLGEVEGRRLYRAAGYPSMLEYCVGELHLSEASAWRRIQVARAARRFLGIFEALADGRLNLTAVLLLRPYLRPQNADELLAAASHRTKSEIEHLIAERFGVGLAPELAGRAKLRLVAPGYYEMKAIVSAATLKRLRHTQDLISHQNPTRNFGVVMDRLMDIATPQLEKQKFGVTRRPRACAAAPSDGRYIPADVRRIVYERDRGRCTFVSANGKRCESRHRLEYDHIVPVASGGKSTVANLRLLCRPHNRLAAEQSYGVSFMAAKIEAAQVEHQAARDGRPPASSRASRSDDPDQERLGGLRPYPIFSAIDFACRNSSR